MLDELPDVIRSMLCGSNNATDHELVQHLCLFFRRFPKLLMDVISETISKDAEMRKVFFSNLVDVDALKRGVLLQNVQLKYGGKIPNSRWQLKFSPILQGTVSFTFECSRRNIMLPFFNCHLLFVSFTETIDEQSHRCSNFFDATPK